MSYESVDALQRTLADSVFSYAADRKKAAGRALGTLVEIVTLYTLRAWDFRDHLAIERSIPEFANPDILHNVEFSLHPIRRSSKVEVSPISLPLTSAKILRTIVDGEAPNNLRQKSLQLLSSDGVLRNACTFAEDARGPSIAHLDVLDGDSCQITLSHLWTEPFAIFECKRVGVEEGMKKGPQTIEKAKQGAYVARSISALQKVRRRSGEYDGVVERGDGTLYSGPYERVLRETVDGEDADLLRSFVLTVGVVSNHGNWFTTDNPNKELKVLAQSYDWLLFLTDSGLAQFIERLLLNPTPELGAAREAFLASYGKGQGKNRFTKVRMDLRADDALRRYFVMHEEEVEGWFNVISPSDGTLPRLQADIRSLAGKDWTRMRAE